MTPHKTFPQGFRAAGASFSKCRTYRYALWREWANHGPQLVVIGLNPSTADETMDDPTIRRCIGFAKREGCGRLVMLNLFGLRATDPREMLAHPDPVGPDNDGMLRMFSYASGVRAFVAAWGANQHRAHLERGRTVAAMFPGIKCFGTTKAGHPKHPLYLRADTPLVAYP